VCATGEQCLKSANPRLRKDRTNLRGLKSETLIKLLMWLVLAVFVVVGAAIVLIPMLVDPNDYKAGIADATKAQTGRELKNEGDLKMTVFPILGVEVGPLSLSNAEGFSAPVFLKSERTQVRVNVLPLLTEQRIEADTIEIYGLHVNLEQNKSGATNWDDRTKGSGKASGDVGSSSGNAPAVAGFALGGLNVKGAQITWKQPGPQVMLTNVDLQTGAVELGKPIEVSGGLDIALSNPAAKGRLDVATTISLNGEDVKADGLTLKEVLAHAIHHVGARAEARCLRLLVHAGAGCGQACRSHR
tara:strand:+ start:1051 stop:1953 length:903 start_codon:yes stop_codon:yes gene_type:complete